MSKSGLVRRALMTAPPCRPVAPAMRKCVGGGMLAGGVEVCRMVRIATRSYMSGFQLRIKAI